MLLCVYRKPYEFLCLLFTHFIWTNGKLKKAKKFKKIKKTI